MFWRKKNKKDFQLYEEELNHIQNLIESKDEDDSDFADGDLMIDLAEDVPDDYDQAEDLVLPDEPDPLPEAGSSENGKGEKKKAGFLKKLFGRKKKASEEDPVYFHEEEEELPEAAEPEQSAEPEQPAETGQPAVPEQTAESEQPVSYAVEGSDTPETADPLPADETAGEIEAETVGSD